MRTKLVGVLEENNMKNTYLNDNYNEKKKC